MREVNFEKSLPRSWLRSLIFHYLWEQNNSFSKFHLISCYILLFLGKAAAVGVPYFFKTAVDTLHQSISLIPYALLISYGFLRGLSVTLIEIQEVLFTPLKQRAVRLISTRAFSFLYELNMDFHFEKRIGDVSTIIEKGSRSLEKLLQYSMFSLIPTLIEILFVLLTVFIFYDSISAFLIGLSISLYIFFTICLTNWRSKFADHANKEDIKCNSSIVESLLMYETIKQFSNESHEIKRHDKLQAAYEQKTNKSKYGIAVLSIGQAIIIAGSLSIIMCYCAFKVGQHSYTLGDFILMNSYLIQLFQPLNILSFTYREIKEAVYHTKQLLIFLNSKSVVENSKNALPLKIHKGQITFENVFFNYKNSCSLLRDINMVIPPKTRVAIVGESGSGKTTLGRLLTRVYQVDKGIISIDGQNIKKVTHQSLWEEIGIVPQDVLLFNESIFYNVHYGNFNATHDEVKQAIEQSNLGELISRLPEGHHTIVGERGVKLSGGEKQRIAIARILLKNPSILIFDEATSALDNHTEQIIQKQFKEIARNKTTLIITHRLSTVTDCDKIFVLKKGILVEQGTHEGLLSAQGYYYDLWQTQQDAYLQQLLSLQPVVSPAEYNVVKGGNL